MTLPRVVGVAWAALAATATQAAGLSLGLELEPLLYDYGLPKHPSSVGQTHAGTLGTASLLFATSKEVRVELGIKGRLPMTQDFEEEVGAIPVLRVEVAPFADDSVVLALGSLRPEHGYHAAILEERRQRYGRPIGESYDRFLPPLAQRNLGGPFMPGEHGVQARAHLDPMWLEAFLDWQLLETKEHREKLAFGALAELSTPLLGVKAQLYLSHYGGEQLTKTDPLRFAGLDRTRQSLSLAVAGRLRAFAGEVVALHFAGAGLFGRAIQATREAPRWHAGGELGLDATFFEHLRASYRLWLPKNGKPGWLSEDGDPIYREGRAHRVGLELTQEIGGLSLEGELSLVLPVGVEAVQYLLFTRALWRFEQLLWRP